MAMKAPWPSEICPLSPVSTVSPATAVTSTATSAIWKSLNVFSLTERNQTTTATTTAAPSLRGNVCMVMSNPPDLGRREQPAGPDHQHHDEDAEGDQRHQAGAGVEVAARVAERQAEQQPADHRAERAVKAADHRGGETEHEDR